MEDVAAKFEAAWEVFARTCANAVAPEAIAGQFASTGAEFLAAATKGAQK